MYKPGRKLLIAIVAAGISILGSALPAKALEYTFSDKPIEKLVTRTTFNNHYLEDTYIEELYSDGTKVMKLDEGSDNKIEWTNIEERLDEGSIKTTFFRGTDRFAGTSITKKLDDGSIRTDFYDKEGRLEDYFEIERMREDDVKITDIYIGGVIDRRETKRMLGNSFMIERSSFFIEGGSKQGIVYERIVEQTSLGGVKERHYDFGADGVGDLKELETTINGVKEIKQYTPKEGDREGRTKWVLGDIITEVTIELKKK